MEAERDRAVARSTVEVNSSKTAAVLRVRAISALACSPVESTWKGFTQVGRELRPTAESLLRASW